MLQSSATPPPSPLSSDSASGRSSSTNYHSHSPPQTLRCNDDPPAPSLPPSRTPSLPLLSRLSATSSLQNQSSPLHQPPAPNVTLEPCLGIASPSPPSRQDLGIDLSSSIGSNGATVPSLPKASLENLPRPPPTDGITSLFGIQAPPLSQNPSSSLLRRRSSSSSASSARSWGSPRAQSPSGDKDSLTRSSSSASNSSGVSSQLSIQTTSSFQDEPDTPNTPPKEALSLTQALPLMQAIPSIEDSLPTNGRLVPKPPFGVHNSPGPSTPPPSNPPSPALRPVPDPKWDSDRDTLSSKNCKPDPSANKDIRGILSGQISENIIAKLEEYQKRAAAAKAFTPDPSEEVPTNFIFKGPPGTGKKTVARALGKLYFDMGLLSTPDMIECTASDLIDRYVGHTGPDTKAQLDNAQGKVLFIDVACRLIDGATEAVNELSHLLRSQKYSRNMVVILAGYEADMNKLMRIRLELSCLFQEEIIFEHIKPENCLELLARELSPKGIDASILQDTVSKNYVKIMRLVRVLSIFPSWSNARDIKNLARKMSAATFIKAKDGPSGLPVVLTFEVAVDCTKDMIFMQINRCSGKGGCGDKCWKSGQTRAKRDAKASEQTNEMEIKIAAKAEQALHQYAQQETNASLSPSRANTFSGLPGQEGPSGLPDLTSQTPRSGAEALAPQFKQRIPVSRKKTATIKLEERRGSGFWEKAGDFVSHLRGKRARVNKRNRKKQPVKGKESSWRM